MIKPKQKRKVVWINGRLILKAKVPRCVRSFLVLAAFVRQTGREQASPAVVFGAPAKAVCKLSKEERAGLKWWTEKYVDNSAYCLKHGINVGGPLAS
jgi:carbonic anhydrase/acetyltransferase-like protein (isoleucine patch superfamily)